MKNAAWRFIDTMAELSPEMRDARDAAVRHWAPEEVPSPVLLLALGHRLADEFDAQGEPMSRQVFDGIEHALAEGDVEMQAAASAMIEAAVAHALDLGKWPDIREMFGERSASHANERMTLDR